MAPPWQRGGSDQPASAAEPSQRTARNAIIAGCLLLIGLLVGAQFFSARWTAPFEMERYVRAGARQGAALLEKDLQKSFPAGSDIGLLFTQLSRMGFSCGAVLDAGRGGDCRFRARREDNRVLTLVVVPRHDGVKLQSVAVSASMTP